MVIRSVELFQITPNIEDFSSKQNFPKILFFGRSNVGKSSLINSLLQNKKIARISSKPGKTTNFHWYLINQSFFFVDAPGYGYAKVPLALRKHWETQFHLLLQQKNLLLIMHLVDIRHLLSDLDKKYHQVIAQGETPYTIIATKADILSNNKRKQMLIKLKQESQIEFFPHSIKNTAHKKEIWDAITKLLRENKLEINK